MKPIAICSALAFLPMAYSSPAVAQCVQPVAKLHAADGKAGERFGSSLAISGELAVFGAPGVADMGAGAGAAYVFRLGPTGWAEEQKLVAADGTADDSFGNFVALSGNVILVGAANRDDNGDNSGAAYVFRYDGTHWVQEQKLVAADGAAGDGFGHITGVYDDLALVGAWGDDDQGTDSGSVYAFRFDGVSWTQAQKLQPPDGGEGRQFSSSLSISRHVAVIGSAFDNPRGAKSGSAYVFRYYGAQWHLEQKLLPSDGIAGDAFGGRVRAAGDLAVITAYGGADVPASPGATYVFRFTGLSWLQEQKLTAPDGAAGDLFGVVSVGDDVVLVGANGDDDNGDNSGSVYLFRYRDSAAQWILRQKVFAADAAAGDRFGNTAVSGSVGLVSVPDDDDSGENSGSVYVFDLIAGSPRITQQSADLTVCADGAATFSVVASGVGPLSYQWRKDGADLPGETYSSLTISDAAMKNAGRYDAVVMNVCGSVTSDAVMLTVNAAPSIAVQPQSGSAGPGEQVTFTVGATGTEPLTYQWRKNGEPIEGANGASYVIAAFTDADQGAYDVVVTNACESVTSTAADLSAAPVPSPWASIFPGQCGTLCGVGSVLFLPIACLGLLRHRQRRGTRPSRNLPRTSHAIRAEMIVVDGYRERKDRTCIPG